MEWDQIQLVFGTVATMAIILSLVWAVKKRSRDYVMVMDCERMREFCMKEKDELRLERNVVGRLETITKQLAEELHENILERRVLFDEVRRAFSVLGDQAMAVQILSAKVLKDEPETMSVVLDLLRKGKP